MNGYDYSMHDIEKSGLEEVPHFCKPYQASDTIELVCWKCLRKEGLEYPGSVKGMDGTCAKCGLEGDDIGLIKKKPETKAQSLLEVVGALRDKGYSLEEIITSFNKIK